MSALLPLYISRINKSLRIYSTQSASTLLKVDYVTHLTNNNNSITVRSP